MKLFKSSKSRKTDVMKCQKPKIDIKNQNSVKSPVKIHATLKNEVNFKTG